ncbi:hypothetical protein ACP4OV_020579 [Aristida adscensionis]
MEGAVVSATQGAVQILLGKLGDVLAKKYALLGGVRDEIQELKDELESMTACLHEQVNGDDDARNEQEMTIWMKQVREVSYDAEDCIDMFCRHLSKHPGESRGLARHIHKIISLLGTLNVRNKLATEIQSLISRAQKVSDRRLRYKVGATEAHSVSVTVLTSSSFVDVDRRLPALHGDASRLVGMEHTTRDIIDLLDVEGDEPRLRVISIVGFGGLGKTTLAMAVYTSPAVHGIQSRAFVPVSQTYDLRSLLESIVRQLHPRPAREEEDPLRGIESWDISQLIRKSQDHLANKRFFIILDDVWRQSAWENLKIVFPDNKKGSRIIITTRSHQVAKSCSSSKDHVYEMKRLSRDDSKKLLFKTVFESEEIPSTYNHLEIACQGILEKCSDLPLAIVSIGGMLAHRRNEPAAKWKTVIDRLPSELETSPSLEGMRRILFLSYNDLPYHLKACFLYLSVFPEDYEIRRGPLVRRWAAEGFISALHDLSLEEIAQSCFDGFVSRSVVTPAQLTSCGEVRSFKVHDIMLEIITSKSIQQNFISFLGNHQHNTVGHDKIRRLSIQPGNRNNKDFSSRSMTHVRSLTILDSTERPLEITFTDLKLVRVLDLEGCRWLSAQDLKDICKLSLLRYLSLRGTAISQLPSMLGKLKGLVTLDIRKTFITELPKSITQLQNLSHLLAGEYNYWTRTHSVKHFVFPDTVIMPPDLGKMGALRRISYVDLRQHPEAMREVGKLSQLTRLSCRIPDSIEGLDVFCDSLSKLSGSLRYLSIIGQQECLHGVDEPPMFLQSLHLVGRLHKTPGWFLGLINLASISLRETFCGMELATVLGNLPSLVSLKLYHDSYMGSDLCFEGGRFPMLKQLVVDNLQNLHKLSFQEGPPNLERLTVSFLHHSQKCILGIQKLEKLREVEFFGNIFDSIVEEVRAEARVHRNHPRVTREDRPTEA